MFEELCTGIELTPEQEQFVQTESILYAQASDDILDRAKSEERDFTETEYQAIADDFFARLEPGLSSKQMQQLQSNQACFFDHYLFR